MSWQALDRLAQHQTGPPAVPSPRERGLPARRLGQRGPVEHEADRVTRVAVSGSPTEGLLQRACSCGGTSGADGMCAECRAKHELAASGLPGPTDSDLEIHLSQNPGDAPPTDVGRAEPAAATCPTDIKIAEIIPVPVTAAQIGKGVRSGWGAITRMEVSGGGRTDWDGTRVKEVLSTGTNDCDKSPGCANTSAQAGNAGSTWSVGQASPASRTSRLGEVVPAQAAKKNSFFDIHVQGGGIDWCADKGSCSRGCTQHYECGGRKFGPDFTVSWSFSSESRKDPDDKVVSICVGTLRKDVAATAK
jgi:hypothetical protein